MLARSRLIVLVLGAAIGAAVAALIAPHIRGLFPIPTGGVGAVTKLQYPKGWDYAVVALLVAGAFGGALVAGFLGYWVTGLLGGLPEAQPPVTQKPSNPVTLAVIVFLAMLVAHDHPYSFMDMYHEGEHLAPASAYLDGARPYGDVFVLHGLATDGGLDVLVLGKKPSPLKTRRLETLLDAVAVALLVPIAAELTATLLGFLGAVLAGFSAIGAGLVPVFPYYRWIPLLIAVLAVLHVCRAGVSPAGGAASRGPGGGTPPRRPAGGRRDPWLWTALLASTLGVLWSVEIGLYSIAATGAMLLLIRPARLLLPAIVAILAPFAVLLAVRADIPLFLADSFVAVPRAADAIAALPARPLSTIADPETARYYLPPVFYGLSLVLALQAWRRGDRKRALQIAAVTLFSLAAFRTAAGRCSWSHTRFGIPLLGVAVVAFAIEPAVLETIRTRRVWRIALLAVVAIPLALYFEIWFNLTSTAKFIAGWRARQKHEGLVHYPMERGRGIYTYAENAADLAAINDLVQRSVPKNETILDLSGERALYYFLDRRPAVRCADVGMLSPPAMSAEALQQLNARPPRLVIVHGQKGLDELDGIPNRERAPAIFAWVDAHYPRRQQVGRYTVALPP